MINRWIAGLWIMLLLGATFAATQAQPTSQESWLYPLIVLLWIVTLLALLPTPVRRLVAAPLNWLHAHAILYWLVLLIYVVVALGLWLVPYQPTNGRQLSPVELAYIAVAFIGLIYLLGYDIHEPDVRAIGARLGKSKLTGIMITVTTLILILIGGEAYLRIFYITTDGYGFTAMNYWWYKDFGWAQNNSLGYRDYEPTPDDPNHPLTRVAVVGDSFVMGHGINNLNDTFPQKLEKMLGTGYDVNVIAQSGWDSDVELYNLDRYPYRPNIFILSYYLNDVDYLIHGTSLSPDNNFAFPQSPAINWVVQTFFVPNYIYYDIAQFSSATRANNFASDLIGVYSNDDIWNKQVPRLYEMVAWAQRNHVRMIALVWPQLAEVDASTPATKRVSDFFRSQNVQVVDMTDVLRGKSVSEITVNRFDSHPSIEADEIAAEQLYTAIQNPPAS